MEEFMKKNYKILIFIVAILIMIICLVSISNRSEIKSIRSEHQLLTIVDSDDYSELNTFERIITMPFSLLYGDRYYSRKYNVDYIEDGYDAFEAPINTTIES
jgi:hypothetical protein